MKLKDGRVLIAGGYARWVDAWEGGTNTSHNGQPYGHDYPFAEIYDPASGVFQTLPSQAHTAPAGAVQSGYCVGTLEGPGMMGTNHSAGSSVELLPDGRVWFGGGWRGWVDNLVYCSGYAEGVEFFNPTSGLFVDAGVNSLLG